MSVTFTLRHDIDTINKNGWLWYSHDHINPPTDRQVYSSGNIMKPKGIGLAPWYFLTDDALMTIGSSPYKLWCITYDYWKLEIDDRSRAALFKLKFL